MNEKLTRDEFSQYWERGTAESRYELWSRIEADREAIRAETREESLTELLTGIIRWDYVATPLVSVVAYDGKGTQVQLIETVRRPPKKRAKTDEEMLNNVIYRLETWEAVARGLARLGSLANVCRDLGIDTEVDE